MKIGIASLDAYKARTLAIARGERTPGAALGHPGYLSPNNAPRPILRLDNNPIRLEKTIISKAVLNKMLDGGNGATSNSLSNG